MTGPAAAPTPRFRHRHPAPSLRPKDYRSFKPFIREDFDRRCAYCLVPEEDVPQGAEIYVLDHYCPKSVRHDLVAHYPNLFWSCVPCNSHKSAYWPPAEGRPSIVNLTAAAVEQHFDVCPDGELVGKTDDARFTIDRLRLNRPSLRKWRQTCVGAVPDWHRSQSQVELVPAP